MVPVTDLNVKSVIASPVAGWIKPGRVRISGTAWSNTSPVARVDVSVDGGSTWKPAKLGPSKLRKVESQYAWRLWQLDWQVAEGQYTLRARATNEAGQTQPLTEEWNPSGYLWNVAQRVDVEVTTKEMINDGLGRAPQARGSRCHPEISRKPIQTLAFARGFDENCPLTHVRGYDTVPCSPAREQGDRTLDTLYQ